MLLRLHWLELEGAFKAGWGAHIEQQTPSGDSREVMHAFTEWLKALKALKALNPALLSAYGDWVDQRSRRDAGHAA